MTASNQWHDLFKILYWLISFWEELFHIYQFNLIFALNTQLKAGSKRIQPYTLNLHQTNLIDWIFYLLAYSFVIKRVFSKPNALDHSTLVQCAIFFYTGMGTQYITLSDVWYVGVYMVYY